MDIPADNAADVVLTAAASGSKDYRFQLLKKLLDTFQSEELNDVHTVLRHQRRRKLKPHGGTNQGQAEVPLPPVPLPSPDPWWVKYGERLSLDCEFVTVANVKDENKVNFIRFMSKHDGEQHVRFQFKDAAHSEVPSIQSAATVAICNSLGEIIYKAKVKHMAGTYLVNKFTLQINGIRYNDLHNGKELQEVKKEVSEILSRAGALIITHTGAADFNALSLPIGEFTENLFDLTNYYRRENGNPYGLKKIYEHYFGVPFQDAIHTAESDAIATMKIFNEGYVRDRMKDAETVHIRQVPHQYLTENFEVSRRVWFDEDDFSWE